MMLSVGLKERKLLVYSQASVTNKSDFPTLMLPPILWSIPPTYIVWSALAARRISVIIEVVVVFPCVPATFTAV